MNNKPIQPSEFAYKSRIKAVHDFTLSEVFTKDEVSRFVEKIIDFMEFLNRDKVYSSKIKHLFSSKKLDHLNTIIDKKNNEILHQAKSMFLKAEAILRQKSIQLPTMSEIFEKHKSGRVWMQTVDESLGSKMDKLGTFFHQDDKKNFDAITTGSEIIYIQYDFNSLNLGSPFTDDEVNIIKSQIEQLKDLHQQRDREKRYLGIVDYETLLGLWDYYTISATFTENSIGYLLSPVFGYLDDKNISLVKNPKKEDVKAELNKYRDCISTLDRQLKLSESEKEASLIGKSKASLYFMINGIKSVISQLFTSLFSNIWKTAIEIPLTIFIWETIKHFFN